MTPPKSVPGRAGRPLPRRASDDRAEAVGVSPRHAGASRFAPRGAATEAHALRRRRPLKHRLILTVIGLAIVLLALSGWFAQAIRVAK